MGGFWDELREGFLRSVGIVHGPVICYPSMGEIKGWTLESTASHKTNERSYKGCLKDETSIMTIFESSVPSLTSAGSEPCDQFTFSFQ